MEYKERETTQKLMDAFFRFRRLHRESPIPGMKHSEVRILFIIKKHLTESGKGVKIFQLSHIMRVTSPTVTQLINSLESSGLVERTMDPSDRRSILVTLTEQGETVLKQASDVFFARFNRLVNHLGEEKSLELAKLLVESFDFMSSEAMNNYTSEQE